MLPFGPNIYKSHVSKHFRQGEENLGQTDGAWMHLAKGVLAEGMPCSPPMWALRGISTLCRLPLFHPPSLWLLRCGNTGRTFRLEWSSEADYGDFMGLAMGKNFQIGGEWMVKMYWLERSLPADLSSIHMYWFHVTSGLASHWFQPLVWGETLWSHFFLTLPINRSLAVYQDAFPD